MKGTISYVPGVYKLKKTIDRILDTQYTFENARKEARYDYTVWLRHLVRAYENGLEVPPEVVAELGPGSSFGVGLSALISGSDKYYALDIVKHGTESRTHKIFGHLLELFNDREDIPDEEEFPKVKPYLDSYKFPDHVLTDDLLKSSMDEERIELIRKALNNQQENSQEIQIKYWVPWYDEGTIQNDSIDFIISQAVLEHVDDLDTTYKALHKWLKLEGIMSHEIDFKSHGYSSQWNGHWEYSERLWNLIRGKRPYAINRQPHSSHIQFIEKNGFKIIEDDRQNKPTNLDLRGVAQQINTTREDLNISSAFIQSKKPST